MSDVPNYGTAGSPLDATNNGLVPVDQAVWFPGTTTNGLVADETSSPVTTMTVTIAGTYDIYGGIARRLTGKQVTDQTWGLQLGTAADGTVQFSTRASGGLTDQQTASVRLDAAGYPAGTLDFIKVEFVLLTSVVFSTSPDGLVWTQLGTTFTPTLSDLNPTTDVLTIGATTIASASDNIAGSISSVSVDYDGTPVFTFDAATDLPPDPAATEFVASTGQTITVNRGTAGPVTTLVPGGAVLINPDITVAGNVITFDSQDNTEFDVGLTEDLLAIYVGQPGLSSDGNSGPEFFSASASVPNWKIERSGTSATDIRGSFKDGATTKATGSPDTGDGREMLAAAVVLDRATGLWSISVYNGQGLIEKQQTDASVSGAVVNGGPGRMFRRIPGTWQSALFNTGVGIAPSDELLQEWAAFLLSRGRADPESASTTGKYPPLRPWVGDLWTASNGHSVTWTGAEWSPYEPLTGNAAALLGNSQLWIGADSP